MNIPSTITKEQLDELLWRAKISAEACFKVDPGKPHTDSACSTLSALRELAALRKKRVQTDLLNAAKAIRDELDGRYDGAPDSHTRWMGEYLTQLGEAIARAEGRK